MAASAVNLIEALFSHGWLLALIGMLPLLAVGTWLARRRRQRGLVHWTGGRGVEGLSTRRRLFLALAGGLVLLLLIVGSAGPQWGRDPQAPGALGRDIMVVLDLSRSMLAEYPPESRLGRAKAYLHQLADTLQRRGGYRLGLTVFARQARVVVPLTEDYDHFRHILEQVHPDGLGGVVRLGEGQHGTQLRPAIELAVNYLDPLAMGFQELLLVSDGDDLAGDWQRGSEAARKARVPVHALGVGDPEHPRRIPHESTYLKYDDEWVTTRRHDDVLESLARGTGGVYVPEQSSTLPLVYWFQNHIAPLPVREWTDDRRPIPVARYGWFFAAALALVLVQMILGDASRQAPEV
jgi:Ca-activated chloride channel homolog